MTTKIHFMIMAGCTFILLNLSPQAHAQNEIERAFEMQKAPTRSKLSVDSEVKETKDQTQKKVTDRQTAKERARAEEMRLASTQSNQSTGGTAYACTVTCTGSWWASGSNVSVTLTADSIDKAKEYAATQANPYCRKQENTSGAFKKTALSAGSAKCERK